MPGFGPEVTMNVKAEYLDDSGGRDRRTGVVEGMGSLDPQLWHACAGGMVQLPPPGAKVIYFPQGHAEQAATTPEFPRSLGPYGTVLCQVVSVKFMADTETDEVFARLRLQPEPVSSMYLNDRLEDVPPSPPHKKPASFAKTLTQSDANNGGGFSVPRYCAETIFPPLDYTADPPVQTVLAKDVHGDVWKFRHIYRGTPRRHLLTTGWSTFVNQKKLVAGDAIVFLRSASGELCVGVRRSMRGTTGSDSSAWHSSTIATSSVPVRPSRWEVKGTESFSDYLDAGPGVSNTSIRPGIANASSSTSSFARNRARVTAKSVLEAATLAVAGKQFEVVYYPRASTAEFCVKAALVKQALDHNWYAGMRFKMAFETEDSSRISWFMGTISAVQPADPLLWPKSPWRVLQVTWDEPDLLQGVGRASPWQVELVATLPMQLPPFPLPKKKPRPALPSELLHLQAPGLLSGLPTNNFVSGQLPPLTEDASAGMQGARHDRIYGLLVSDFPTSYKQSRDFIPDTNFFHAEHDPPARTSLLPDPKIFSSLPEHLSLPAAELPSERSATTNKTGPRSFFLFGQSINPAQSSKPQLQLPPVSNSSDGLLLPTATGNWLLQNKQEDTKDCIKQFTSVPNGRSMGTEGRLMWYELNGSRYKADQLGDNLIGNLEWLREPVSAQGKDQISGDVTFLCKVFRESEEVGRTLDLSKLATYEELYERLAAMFSIPKAHLHDRVVYKADGFTKGIGQEPYRNFATSVRRITILSERETSFDTLS